MAESFKTKKMKQLQVLIIYLFFSSALLGQVITLESFWYDDLDRLSRIEFQDDVIIEYCYDPLGNRTCRVITGGNQVTVDLTPTDGMVANQASVGGAITGTYTSNNLGADPSGSFTTYYVLSLNGTYEPGQDILLRSVQTPNLVGGAMVTVELDITVPNSVPPDDYQLLIIQDPGGLVEELSETNNILAWPITVQDCAGNITLLTSTSTANCGGTTGGSISASGGTAPYTYEWSTVPVQEGSTVSNLTAGTYTVTVTDALGCVLIEDYVVMEGDVDPVANFGYARDGLMVTFTNISSGGGTASWVFGDGGSSASANPMHTYAQAGNYEVCLTVSNQCGADLVCQTFAVGATNCPLPVNLLVEAVTETTASLSWNSGGAACQLEYSSGGDNWVYAGIYNGEVAAINGLTSNTTYEWRVRSSCTTTLSLWSSIAYFTTASGEPVDTGEAIFKRFTATNSVADRQIGWADDGKIYYSWVEGDDYVISKFDEQAEHLWTRRITGFDARENNRIIGTTDGGAICAIQIRDGDQYGVLLKFSVTGGLQWSRRIEYGNSGLDSEIRSLVQVPGGYVGVGTVERLTTISGQAGSTKLDAALMFKVNDNGALLWSNVATPVIDVDQYFTDVTVDDAGVLYAVGEQRNGNLTRETFVIRANSSGSLQTRSGLKGAVNDKRQQGFISVINASGNPNGANGIYLRTRSIIQGNSAASAATLTKLNLTTLSPVWSYSYGSSSDGRVSVDVTTGSIYFSYGEHLALVDQQGDVTVDRQLKNGLGLTSNDGIFNGANVLLNAYSGSNFGIVITDVNLVNDCALEPDSPPSKVTIPNTVSDVMSGAWLVANYINAQSINPATSSETIVVEEGCVATCEVFASIQDSNTPICLAEDLLLYSISTDTDSVSWTNLTTGESLGSFPSTTFIGANSGTFVIQLEAFNGECNDLTTTTIEVLADPVINLITTNEECGAENGTAAISLVDPTATYEWSTGETGVDISDLPAGVYSVLVKGENGCTNYEDFVIENTGSELSFSVQTTNESCPGASDGTAIVFVSGATGNLAVSWTGGMTGEMVDGLAVGPYSVTVTDDAGCSALREFVIEGPEVLSATTNHTDNSNCEVPYNGMASSTATGGTPPFVYSWSGRAETTASVIGVQAYSGVVTVTDANGCELTRNVTIVDSGGDCPTCSDGAQNGDETSIDCGGPDCMPCIVGGSMIILQDSIAEAGGEVSYELVVVLGAEVELLIDNISVGIYTGDSGLLTLSKVLPGVHYLRLMEAGQEIDRAVVRFESCRWAPYFTDGNDGVLLDRCTAIKNGVAYVPSLLYPANSTPMGRSGFISVNNFKLDADSLELTIVVKDHASEEPFGYEQQMTINLLGNKGYATIRLYERGAGNMEGFVDWPSGNTSALNFAILDFSTWNSFSVLIQEGQLMVGAGSEIFTSVPLEGALGALLGADISFSGSGSLDYVVIEDQHSHEKLRENFDVCDCEMPGAIDKPIITSIHKKELRLALPTPLAPAPRAQNDLIILGEFNGRYTGSLQRDGQHLVFLSETPFSAGEELNVTLAGGLLLEDGSTTSKYTWKTTVPARHVTDGHFFLAPLGIQLPSNALDNSYSFSTADFDQNGTMDIVFHYYISYGAPSNQLIYLRNPDQSFSPPLAYSNNRSHSSIQGTPDLNGDGYPDLLVRHNFASSVMLRFNNGDGSFGGVQYYTVALLHEGFG